MCCRSRPGPATTDGEVVDDLAASFGRFPQYGWPPQMGDAGLAGTLAVRESCTAPDLEAEHGSRRIRGHDLVKGGGGAHHPRDLPRVGVLLPPALQGVPSTILPIFVGAKLATVELNEDVWMGSKVQHLEGAVGDLATHRQQRFIGPAGAGPEVGAHPAVEATPLPVSRLRTPSPGLCGVLDTGGSG